MNSVFLKKKERFEGDAQIKAGISQLAFEFCYLFSQLVRLFGSIDGLFISIMVIVATPRRPREWWPNICVIVTCERRGYFWLPCCFVFVSPFFVIITRKDRE